MAYLYKGKDSLPEEQKMEKGGKCGLIQIA